MILQVVAVAAGALVVAAEVVVLAVDLDSEAPVDVVVAVELLEVPVDVGVVVVAGPLTTPEVGDEVPVMILPAAPVPVLDPEIVDLYTPFSV